MPLDYQQNINEHCKLAVWRIEEREAFFDDAGIPSPHISHPHKRLQHLAARYLLKQLQPDFPLHEIEIHPAGKPFLAGERYWFSLSHCDDEAAAIVSERNHVGVDIETISDKIEKVKHKFISANENRILQSATCEKAEREMIVQDQKLIRLTIAWSVKEAVFKWYGKGGIDFIRHMQIVSLRLHQNTFSGDCRFSKGAEIQLPFNGVIFRRNVLLWVDE